MTSVYTGPSATALHHLLAALQQWTGLEPIWLLAALVAGGAFLATATCWAIEVSFREPTQRVGGAQSRRT